MIDANGNSIHIVYNDGTNESNNINVNGTNRITSVYCQPKDGETEKIFGLTYDENNLLTDVTETYGNSYKIGYISGTNGEYLLKRIRNYDSVAKEYVESVRYGYGSSDYVLQYVVDAETDRGMSYYYEQSATGNRICRFHEGAAGNAIGDIASVNFDELRKTTYKHYGIDRTENTSDDIFTTYLFNSSGQTINVYSTDAEGNLLGVTAADYEQNQGTSGKNHRISNTISAGQLGVNLLLNSGFEKFTKNGNDVTADGWTHVLSGGSAACRETNPRSGDVHYNIYNSDSTETQTIYQNVLLSQGKTYTASVYVNTSNVAQMSSGGGAYLMISDANGNSLEKGTMLQYKTDANIDNGWQRISVTFTPSESKEYRICLVWEKVKGTVRADDMQLEEGEAPSSYNHIYNGSFEIGEVGWTLSDEGLESVKTDEESNHGRKAMHTSGHPRKESYAKQQIPLNKSGASTFLLSGWSKGNSIPDLESSCETGAERFWGISVKLVYEGGSEETHYLPFNEYIQEWQYASMAVVPERVDTIIDYAEIGLHYNKNANAAYFDNISLTEEPAQSYDYNEEGNITTASVAGNGEESYTYDSEQNITRIETEDSGTYELDYENEENTHLPTTITSDTVTADITYDSYGQATEIVQTDNEEGLKLTGSTDYSNGLLVSETDDAGTQTSYTYNAKRQLHKVINANGQTITTQYEDVYGYPSVVFQSRKISAGYEYTNGNLSGISRGGYITSGGAKQNQTYVFDYDVFGNLTSVSVGNNRLTGYTYNSGNGTLKTMSFGVESNPLATISYGYDKLDRVKNVTYHDTNSGQNKTYGYRYSADGNLAGVTEGSELKYTYEYDSLGRLIYSSQLENGNTKLYTKHQYDTSDRITAQSWQIGNEAFSESYTYREADGSIQSMNIGNETIGFTCNGLKQLTKRTSPKFDTAYEYRVLDEDKKIVTSQISSMKYLKPGSTEELLPALSYTYDLVGNITNIQSGSITKAQYVYDEQNQLKSEILPSQTSSYGYDTYGNIRSKAITDSLNKSESYSFSYENANWLDQLTKVSYTDKNGTTTTKALTYDSIGNPLSYFNGKSNWTFTWKYGRELAAATCGDTSIAYTYNENGIRESKTVGNIIHKYLTLDDKVIRETYGNTTIDYFYDEQGRAYKLVAKENGTTYTGYFVLNQQGDTIALLDANGVVAVTYEYDAWDKEISHSTIGTVGNKLYQYNALKYRGYYYDAESGFYYLSSRYYDPEVGRFLNADTTDVLGVQDDFSNMNLYAYCNNNPINMIDLDGKEAVTIGSLLIFAGLVVSAYYTYKGVKKAISYFREHRTTKNGSKKKSNDKHTKPRPGRASEKKKQSSSWKSRK